MASLFFRSKESKASYSKSIQALLLRKTPLYPEISLLFQNDPGIITSLIQSFNIKGTFSLLEKPVFLDKIPSAIKKKEFWAISYDNKCLVKEKLLFHHFFLNLLEVYDHFFEFSMVKYLFFLERLLQYEDNLLKEHLYWDFLYIVLKNGEESNFILRFGDLKFLSKNLKNFSLNELKVSLLHFFEFLMTKEGLLFDIIQEKLDSNKFPMLLEIISLFLSIIYRILEENEEKHKTCSFYQKTLRILSIIANNQSILSGFLEEEACRIRPLSQILFEKAQEENSLDIIETIIEVFNKIMVKKLPPERISYCFFDFLLKTLLKEELYKRLDKSPLKKSLDQMLLIIKTSQNPLSLIKLLLNSFNKSKEVCFFDENIFNFGEFFSLLLDLIIKTNQYMDTIESLSLFLSNFLLKNPKLLEDKNRVYITEFYKKAFINTKFLLNILEEGTFLKNFFENAINKENIDIFLVFLNLFFKKVLLEEENPFFRKRFFNCLDEYFFLLKKEELLQEEFHLKCLNFFCIFFQIVIFQRKDVIFEDLFENREEAVSLEFLFNEKRSQDYAIYLLTTYHFEKFLDLLLGKPCFQTKLLLLNVFKLTYTILTSSPELKNYFKDNNLDQKLYFFLRNVYYRHCLELDELLLLLNLMLNMGTEGEYYFLIEKYLFCRDFPISPYNSPKHEVMSQKRKGSFNNDERTRKINERTNRINEGTNRILHQSKFSGKKPLVNENRFTEISSNKKTFNEKEISDNLSKNDIKENPFIILQQPFNTIKDFSSSPHIILKEKPFIPKDKRFVSVSNNTIIRKLSRGFYHYKEIDIRTLVDKYSINFADISKYIRIRIPYFLDLVLKFLYETVEIDGNIKMFYITVFKSLISYNSSYNAALLAQDFIIIRLLLSLRLEKEENIREELSKVLVLVLENYINNHHIKAIFSLMHYNIDLEDLGFELTANIEQNTQSIKERGSFFTKKLQVYNKQLISKENYYNFVLSILKMLHNLSKGSESFDRKNTKFLDFSGQNSGIILTNFCFPISSFTLQIDLVLQNLFTSEKRDLQFFYQNYNKQENKSPSQANRNQDYMLSSDWPEAKYLDSHHFSSKTSSPYKKKKLQEQIKGIKSSYSLDLQKSGRYPYQPRLLSLVSHDKTAFLDFYFDQNRHLNIELFDKAKENRIVETFEYKFEEKKLYQLIISYCNEKKLFQAFVQNQKLPSKEIVFQNLSEKFLYPQFVAFGCSPIKILEKSLDSKILRPLAMENTLSGSFFSLKLMDISYNSTKKVPSQKELNMNLFEFLTKYNFQEGVWASLLKSEPHSLETEQLFDEGQKKGSTFGFLNKLFGLNHKKSPLEKGFFDVKSRGVAFLEKTDFLDFFLIFGNVEVFYYFIESLTELEWLENDISHEILSLIFQIIQEISKKNETEAYLKGSCGLKVLVYLLNLYIQKKGCSLPLFEKILSFSQSLTSNELSIFCFNNLIFNLELYYKCEKPLLLRVISEISQKILNDPSYYEEKNTVFYLFYSLSNFFPLENHITHLMMESITPIEKNSLKTFLSDLMEVRTAIMKLLETLILSTQDHNLYNEHLHLLIQNLTEKESKGASIKEFLMLFKTLLKKRKSSLEKKPMAKETSQNPIEKVEISSLKEKQIIAPNLTKIYDSIIPKNSHSLQNVKGTSHLIPISVDFNEKFKKCVKNIEVCKTLISLMLSMDKESYFFKLKKLLGVKDMQKELDNLIALIVNLLFYHLFEEKYIYQENQVKINKKMETYSYLEKPSEEKTLKQKENSEEKTQITLFIIIETLDGLLPEVLGEKTLAKLIDFLRYTLQDKINLNFEQFLIPIIFKRALKLTPALNSMLWKELTSIKWNLELQMNKLHNIPNLMCFLSDFTQKMLEFDTSTLFKGFLSNYLLSLLQKDSGFKYIRDFMVFSKANIQKNIETVLNQTILLINTLLNDPKAFTQWIPQEGFLLEQKVLCSLRNIVFLLYFIEIIGSIIQIEIELGLLLLFIDKAVSLFEKTELLYSSIPEIPSSFKEADLEKLWEKISQEKEEVSLKSGGIFFSIVNMLFFLMNKPFPKSDVSIKSIVLLGKIYFPLKKRLQKTQFETGNTYFKRLFLLSAQEASYEKQPIPEYFNVSSKLSQTPSSFHQKYCDILFYKLLESIGDMLENEQNEKFQTELILFLKEIIEGCEIDFHSKISSLISFNRKKSIPSNPNPLILDQKARFIDWMADFKEEQGLFENLAFLSKEAPFSETEALPLNFKSLMEGPAIKIEFLVVLKGIIEKGYFDIRKTIKEMWREVMRSREEINGIIRPLMYLFAYRPILFGNIVERFKLEMIMEKETVEILENFLIKKVQEDIRKSFEREATRNNEKFVRKSKEFNQKEEILIMKSSKRWNYIKSQLITSKGFWYVNHNPKPPIYKLEKQMDKYQRRFFLKPMKFPEQNQYLSDSKKKLLSDQRRISMDISNKTPLIKKIVLESKFLIPVREEEPHHEDKSSFLIMQDVNYNQKQLENSFTSNKEDIPSFSPPAQEGLYNSYNSINISSFSPKNQMSLGENPENAHHYPSEPKLKPRKASDKSVSSSYKLSKKDHEKFVRGLFKEDRKLQFSHMDLQQFSRKEIEEYPINPVKTFNPIASKEKSLEIIGDSSFLPHKTQNLRFYAEKITIKGAYYGVIELTKEDLIFRSLGKERPDNGPIDIEDPKEKDPIYELFAFGSKKENFLYRPLKKQWSLSEVVSVQGRSFNLRQCAFEVFTIDNKGYFFNIYDGKLVEKFIQRLQQLKKNKIEFFYNRVEAFKISETTDKWTKGLISNYEYLSLLNKYAGRTYNDIHQYPVFPWILSDYLSENLDLNNPASFRDLGRPIGAMNPNRLKTFRENYNSLIHIPESDIFNQPFLYGTHYSGTGPVLHFLLRLEPFASQHIELQSGSFDCADRLFFSIATTWKSCLDRDFKELTPEFFYLPEFLLNKNSFEFGEGHYGDIISNVELPRWAKSAYEFVFRNREALESDYVSKNLHKWVDLIFGFKQTGKMAHEADNVYMFLTYENNVDLMKITNLKDRKCIFEQIAELGQTPHQLLTIEHPPKQIFRLDKCDLLHNATLNPDSFEFCFIPEPTSILKVSFCNNYQDISVFLSTKSLLFFPFEKFAIDLQGKHRQLFFEAQKAITIPWKLIENEINPSYQLHVFSQRKKTFIIGGCQDGSLRVFVKGKELKKSEEFCHRKPISSVAVCEECNIIACGSKDCRISLWKYDKEMGLTLHVEAGGLIYGHNSEVNVIKINEILDVLISVDRDGVVLMHEIRRGRFIRKIGLLLRRGEFVISLDIHENGLILISTNENKIFLYGINGDLVNNWSLSNELKCNYRSGEARFISKWNSLFAVGDNEGEILIFDCFEKEKINTLPTKKGLNEVHIISSFDIHEGERNVGFLCGFEKGLLLMMNLFDEEKYKKQTLANKNNDMAFLRLIIDHE